MKQLQSRLLSALMALALFACGLIPSVPTIPTPDFFAEPTESGTPGPKSRLAGHWSASAGNWQRLERPWAD
jgi:hypothetical protein